MLRLTLPTMTVTLDLAGLQDIDDELARARADLAKVETQIGPDSELEGTRERISGLDSKLHDVTTTEKSLADEADLIGDRITSEEKRLYEGTAKFPKELAGIEQEIASLHSRKSDVEDAALELLEQSSELDAERVSLAATEARLNADWKMLQGSLEDEAAALRTEEAKLLEKRHAQTETISSGTLDLYEDLRRRKAGIAVSAISGAICGGCRIQMPDAVRSRVMSESEMPQCPNCERILVLR